MIPAEAREAAQKAARELFDGKPPRGTRAALGVGLEAAMPYLLAGVIALSDQWEAEGVQSMAAAKQIPDEDIAAMLLMDGAAMVEYARLVRAAIGGAE